MAKNTATAAAQTPAAETPAKKESKPIDKVKLAELHVKHRENSTWKKFIEECRTKDWTEQGVKLVLTKLRREYDFPILTGEDEKAAPAKKNLDSVLSILGAKKNDVRAKKNEEDRKKKLNAYAKRLLDFLATTEKPTRDQIAIKVGINADNRLDSRIKELEALGHDFGGKIPAKA